MIPLCEVGAVAARTAGRVDRTSRRQRLEELVHDGLVDVEQAVARFVVGAGPLAVTGRRVTGPDVNASVRGEPLVSHEGAHLGEPRLDEALVEVARPRSQ